MHAIKHKDDDIWLADDVPLPELKEKEVLIEVHCSGVNRVDIIQRFGKYYGAGKNEILGVEVSGIIIKKNGKCSRNDINVGDKVMALTNGCGYSEFVNVLESQVIKLPNNISFVEGAGICEVFLTTYQLLYTNMNNKKNATNDNNNKKVILIHAGCSGIGTTAIQYAKLLKMKIIVTVGSVRKANYLKNKFDNYIDSIILYKKHPNWDEIILNKYPNGVDIILDCVGPSYFNKHINVAAVDALWMIYGALSGHIIEDNVNLRKFQSKRVSLVGTTLRTRSNDYKTNLFEQFNKNVMLYIISGEICPIIDKTFDINNVSQAHEYIKDNKNIGKVILLWNKKLH